jgi:hypothetical protein
MRKTACWRCSFERDDEVQLRFLFCLQAMGVDVGLNRRRALDRRISACAGDALKVDLVLCA